MPFLYMFTATRTQEQPEGVVEQVFGVAYSGDEFLNLLEQKFGSRDWTVWDKQRASNIDHLKPEERARLEEHNAVVIVESLAPKRSPAKSANELYQMTPISTSRDVYELISGWHAQLPEVSDRYLSDTDLVTNNTRIEIRVLKDPYIDGERCATLQTIWFDDKPVMVTQHAGRSGHDFQARFVTDADAYKAMIQYIRSALLEEPEVQDRIDPNEHLRALTSFYGYADLLIESYPTE